MRTRLSASYSIGVKLATAFIVFMLVFLTSVNLKFTAFLGRAGAIAFVILLFWACFKLSEFIYKEGKILEFDQQFLYLVDCQMNTELKIPLEDITWLNMRPNSFKLGAVWFIRYSLHYQDELQLDRKIRFFINWENNPLPEFVNLVKQGNSNFRYKNWSGSFDFKD